MKKLTTIKQKSFTLIELIAVLLILGILAAVAVPKYIDLVTESEVKACEGAVASMNGLENMLWSKYKLDSTYGSAGFTDADILAEVKATVTTAGDFTATDTLVSYVGGTGSVTVVRTPSESGTPGYWAIQ